MGTTTLPGDRPEDKKRFIILGIAIFAAAFIIACFSLGGFFWADDFWLIRIAKNGDFFSYWKTTAEDFQGFWAYDSVHFRNRDNSYYWYFRPLETFSLFIDDAVYGSRVWGFHLTNSFIWGAAALSFFAMASGLFSLRAAFIAAFIFAVFPPSSEASAWIAARSGPMAASIVFLAAAVSAGKLADEPKKYYAVMLALMVVGLSAQETAWFALPWAAFAAYRQTDANRRKTVFRGLALCVTLLLPAFLFVKFGAAPPAKNRIETLHLLNVVSPDFIAAYASNLANYLLSAHAFLPLLPIQFLTGVWIVVVPAIAAAPLLYAWAGRKAGLGATAAWLFGLMLAPLLMYSITAPTGRYILLSSAAVSLLYAGVADARLDKTSVKIGVIAVLAFLSLYGAWQRKAVSLIGGMVEKSAAAAAEQCGKPAAGKTLYLLNLPWNLTFFDKTLQIVTGDDDLKAMVLTYSPTAPPKDYVGLPFAYEVYCAGDLYGCRKINHVYSYDKTEGTLTSELENGAFFSSRIDHFTGLTAWALTARGTLYKNAETFSVYENGKYMFNLPASLSFDFYEKDPYVCVYEDGKFYPLK